MRIAKVTTASLTTERPDWASDATQILTKADEIPQHLSDKDRGAFEQRVIFTLSWLHGAGEDRAAECGSRSPREGRVDA